jgi:hypothetical protein
MGANQRMYVIGLVPESDPPPPDPKMPFSCSGKKESIF